MGISKVVRALFAGLLLVGPSLLAQAPAPSQEPKTPADFTVTARYVLVPVTVTDSKGKFINGLTQNDFSLYDNHKLQQITVDQGAHPVSLVVAIQQSAAMEKILPQIQKTASLYDGLVLGEAGEMAVIGFDHRIQTLTPFTSDPQKIAEAFKKLKSGSQASHLDDAANEGINMLRNREKNRKRILLLISESRDNGSEMRVKEVMTAAELNDVVIFTVDVSHLMTSLTGRTEPNRPNPIPPQARPLPGGVIGSPTTDMQMEMGNWIPAIKEIFTATKAIFVKNPLEVFTKYSGGREYSFMTQRSLEKAISDLGEEIQSQYLLTYKPNNTDEAGFHDVKVVVNKLDLTVRNRDGYWMAADYR